jgi:hypothetical protein
MLEAYLLASGRTGEDVAKDKIILESEWRPSDSKGPISGSDDEGLTEVEFYENYTSGRPQLGEIQAERESVTGEIMSELLNGKLSVKQIANENYVTEEGVRSIMIKMSKLLGLDNNPPTENQKILKAIIYDRLTGKTAAEIFLKKPSDISRRKRHAKERLKEYLLE